MAFSYTYGTYRSLPGVQFQFRAFIAYEVVTNNDTTYTVRFNGGAQVSLNNEIGINDFTVKLSGDGQTTKTNSDLDYRNPASTDGSRRQTAFTNFTWSWTKGTAAATKTIKCTLAHSNMTTDTATYTLTVPARTSYSIAYNANGGSGAPAGQTKYYGTALTLQSGKPTRTGYSFVNWNTKADGSGTSYSSGGSYTANAAATLYAQWKINTYTVSYNANGGTGSIANQTKTYGVGLTLSNGAGFTKDLYELVKWNTAADGSGTDYALGDTYSANAGVTLYAVWKLAYTMPVISNFECYRVASHGSSTETDDGEYIYIGFDYVGGSIDGGVTEINPVCVITVDGTQKHNAVLTGSPFSIDYGTYSKDSTHTVTVKLYDGNYPTGVTENATINTATYALDLLGTGMDIYVGINHPAVSGLAVATGDLYIELNTGAGSGTTDGDLYAALVALGWNSEVIV